jgi:Domain of unknown function (DUF4175)
VTDTTNSGRLNAYILRLQGRLRLGAALGGAAVFAGSALGVTVALVFILNRFAFPAHGVAWARIVLIAALATAATLGIALPLLRLTRAHAVRRAESATPDLEDRLTTFEERANANDPFIELLAADTLARTGDAEPATLVPSNRLAAISGAGLGCLAVLVWMVAAGPGYLGYGASLLWTGAKKNATPFYSITVAPGNVAVRRNSDQLIVARVAGMRPDKAQLFAHFQSAAGWEPVNMQPGPDAAGSATYQFVLAGLPENVEYYVAAGPLVSPHYKVRVVDLPSVKNIRVTYRYPQWTGMKSVVEDHSGDLRAIEGTDAQLEVEMDRPLKDGQLALDGGPALRLAAGAANKYTATIHMEKDGAYHVAATDEGQTVRLSEDYFIATDKAMPPEIAISRPTGDYRASPIEEVTVGAKAADEFGLTDMHLHYSVNGGPDHDLSLLKTPGAKNADGSTVLPLEDLKLIPGDVISVYATARDGHSEARTDISFIQVDPFEREFSQSQQSGGGGGGGGGSGDNQTEISRREKELIAATWKQQNDKTATPKDNAAQGQFLSDAQQKLRDQVNALSVRMQSRDISEANQEFTDFDKDMQAASAAMGPASDKLKSTQWKDALPMEQKALQALLRAEATFRQIEVAFGQRGGGGGGGGGSTGRDLASLFDLELDTEKNQYETAQSSSPAEQHEKDVEDALAKLDALAKRQEDLANQQQNPQQSFQERWQQEMLRREAEELQRQMEQMAQNGQQGQQGSQGTSSSQANQESSGQQGSSQNGSQSSRSQSGRQSSGSSGGQSSGGQSSGSQANDQRVQQALNRLNQATDAMKRNGDAQQSAEAAREAAERLRDATNLLAGSQQQLASNKVDSLAHEAGRLSQEERDQAERINKLANQQDNNQNGTAESAAGSGESSSSNGGNPDLQAAMARMRERDQLAGQRQELSNDLSKLEKNLRDTAREMAPNQPGVAQKLRDALTEMDDSDLDNHVQRTADWLRGGINPNSNGTEGEIAQGLQKLSQQLAQAQSAMGQSKPGSNGRGQGDSTAALGQLDRLRGQLEALGRGQNGSEQAANQDGRSSPGQSSQRNEQQSGQQSGEQNGRRAGNGNGMNRNGQASGEGGQNGPPRDWQQAQQPLSRSGQPGNDRAGQPGGNGAATGANNGNRNGGTLSGDTRNGGGGRDGTVWGNFDTGNNTPRARGQQQAAPADASGNPADTERNFDQGMRELSQLRQMVHDDPQAAKDVADLTRQMQNLDPRRFPGNPAMVEQMHQEILSSVDKLELQLQHDNGVSEARATKPSTIPAGYRDSVAEYYRKLSKNP